ncbi:hypothetical protein EV182_002288, partial [Spiromyces aspiralis]
MEEVVERLQPRQEEKREDDNIGAEMNGTGAVPISLPNGRRSAKNQTPASALAALTTRRSLSITSSMPKDDKEYAQFWKDKYEEAIKVCQKDIEKQYRDYKRQAELRFT